MKSYAKHKINNAYNVTGNIWKLSPVIPLNDISYLAAIRDQMCFQKWKGTFSSPLLSSPPPFSRGSTAQKPPWSPTGTHWTNTLLITGCSQDPKRPFFQSTGRPSPFLWQMVCHARCAVMIWGRLCSATSTLVAEFHHLPFDLPKAPTAVVPQLLWR